MSTLVGHFGFKSGEVDPRGMRCVAAITSLVLATVLVTESTILLAIQVGVFGVSAILGVRSSPYSMAFARLVRPRLGSPVAMEDARPPQFAQAVGLVFAVVGLVGLVSGVTTLGLLAVGLALVAAFLNAAFGLCLGCEVYLFINRSFPARARAGTTTTEVSA